jgi:perosamine synthetase
MLRFIAPAGTPLSTAEILRGAKAAVLSAGHFDRSLSSLAQEVHARSAVGTRSGRSALWLVLKALHRLRPDRSLVAHPAYTCFTVPAAVVRAGLKPCLIDIHAETLDFDFDGLERISSSGLLCVVTSNLFGLPNNLERIREIAWAQGAFVVDDAAQALGASSCGEWAGLAGDAGVFSFGRGKALAAIEGGLAVTNSEEIGAALELEALMQPKASASHSLSVLLQMSAYAALLHPRLYWIPNSIPFLGLGATEFAPGFPISRMSNVTMGLLSQIISKLEETNAARVKNAAAIIDGLDGLGQQPGGYMFPAPLNGSRPVYTRLPVIARDSATRDRAVASLRAAGIGASPFYPSALCDIPDLQPFLAPRLCHCPAAESVAQRLFTLPTHPYVTQPDIDRMLEILSDGGRRISDRELLLEEPQCGLAAATKPVTSRCPRPFGGEGGPRSGPGEGVVKQLAKETRNYDLAMQTTARASAPVADDRGTLVDRQSAAASAQSSIGTEFRSPIPEARIPITETQLPGFQSQSKRLLLIAFDFPPRRTSGIYRPTGLAKYLTRLGWETTVLTINADAKDLQDPSLLQRIPSGTRVVRTRYLNFMAWEDSAAGSIRNFGALSPDSAASHDSIVNRCLRWLAAFVRSCVYFPDDTSGWIPFGVAKAIQLARQEHFDVVYTTSPPRSSMVVGLFLKTFLRIPWVAEFRDPWFAPKAKIRRWAERRLLGMIGHKADAVVVVTSTHADEFRSLRVPAQKIKVVPNGFDEDDFRPDRLPATTRTGLLKPGYLHFTHLGTIYPNDSGKFFEALKDLIREFPGWGKKIRINIVGYPDETVQRCTEDEILHPLLNVHGFVGHSQSIEIMRASHCMLLFRANRDFAQLCVGGKTYEYLRSGRPILAITYSGPTKTLIQEGNAGWVIHPDDKHGIKQALRTIITTGSGLAAKHTARKEFTAQYRYDRLAAKMAAIFNSVSSPKGAAPTTVWLPPSNQETGWDQGGEFPANA